MTTPPEPMTQAERLRKNAPAATRPTIAAIMDEAATTITTLAAERDALREALERLEVREAAYRHAHDLHGDGSIQAGRAWDQMRRAGNEARTTLERTAQP